MMTQWVRLSRSSDSLFPLLCGGGRGWVIALALPKQSNGMESSMILGFLARCLPRVLTDARNDEMFRFAQHDRIPRKSARKAMAKPQHSAALKIAIFDSLLLMILSSQPQRTAAMFEP